MSVNNMTFEQSATLLTSLVNQATGVANLTPTDESEFVSMAQTALKQGYDYMATAISQVLAKTIFSVRNYDAKFKGLEVDQGRWGAITRKINYLDIAIDEQDDRYLLTDNQSMDMYNVNKVKAVQTNFYGENVWQVHYTIYRDQLDRAFESSAQFGSFMAGAITNINNQIEQIKENERRIALQTLMAGTISRGTTLHLLTEYKNQTGNTTIDGTNWMSEAEFPYFVKWLYGYLNYTIDLMSERTALYHQNIATYNGVAVDPIMRHTPRAMLKGYILNSLMKQINSSVMSSVYHNDLLNTFDFETVNYWQAIQDPDHLSITPVVMTSTGDFETGDAVDQSGVIGVLFDEEAAGVGLINEWGATTPFNPRGGYWNQYFHFTTKPFVDYTENCIVLLMD